MPIKHPARYTTALLPIFATVLEGHHEVLDPFAGTGRIHELMSYGDFYTTAIEIEPEWANMHYRTLVGDATNLPFQTIYFDAICTSPCYGNRFADSHEAKDGSERRSYTHDLGRKLSANNAGGLQWGDKYRQLHITAWREAIRVLRPGGLFVLNIKDHIRKKERQYVSGWHVTTLCRLGLELQYHIPVGAPTMRKGANNEARINEEQIYVFRKPE